MNFFMQILFECNYFLFNDIKVEINKIHDKQNKNGSGFCCHYRYDVSICSEQNYVLYKDCRKLNNISKNFS